MAAEASPVHVVALAMPGMVGQTLASVRPKNAESMEPMIWPCPHVNAVVNVAPPG